MICPMCASEKSFVVKTIKELKVSRWRKCRSCGYGWLTEEKPVKDKDLLEYIEYIEKFDDKVKSEKN